MSQSIRILSLTRYERLGSSSRVCFYQYFPYLKAHGIDIINSPFFEDDYVRDLYAGRKISLSVILKAYHRRLSVLTRNDTFDLLWVEKELLPWFPAGIESLFRSRTIPYVVEYDDAVFHRYDLHAFAPVRLILGKKIDNVMHHAAMVIVGNDYLAERARKAGARRVEYIPSAVNVNQYAIKQQSMDDAFKIGWIGSPVTSAYLNLIRDVMSELNRESPVKLVLVGASHNQLFPDIPTEALPWSEELERTVNQKFDVGIMPLVDGPFERGKCGYKLIQYMAGGIPVIASPVGVNQQIVEAGTNGFFASSATDWLSALRTLRDNPQLRKEMGQAGRLKAELVHNTQVTAPRLLELLMSAAKTQINA